MKYLNPLMCAALITVTLFAHAQTKPKEYNPFESIGKKGKVVTAYGDRFVEVFDYDSIQRIGSVMFHIYKKKIVRLLNADSTFKKVSDNSSASRWYSVDPKADKYHEWSPYVFAADNPIRYNDPDGQEFGDPNGKKIVITYSKDGSIKFSKNATDDVIRITTGMAKTETGLKMLHTMDNSKVKISMTIDKETVIRNADGTIVAGETKPTISQNTVNGKPVGEEFISKAKITIYEAGINKSFEEGSGKMSINGTNVDNKTFTTDDIISSYGVHEGTHATDKGSSRSLNKGKDPKEIEKKPYENQLRYLKELEEKNKSQQ